MKFGIASRGAVIEGAALRFGAYTPDSQLPWALFCVPIAAMLTPAGIAWIELVLREGEGFMQLLVAPETLNTGTCVAATDMHGAWCFMWNGEVQLDGTCLREGTDGWGEPMTVGERVRLVYVAATRMLSVILHGVSIELVALPAHHDIAATRFGVALGRGHAVRITGASAGACRLTS